MNLPVLRVSFIIRESDPWLGITIAAIQVNYKMCGQIQNCLENFPEGYIIKKSLNNLRIICLKKEVKTMNKNEKEIQKKEAEKKEAQKKTLNPKELEKVSGGRRGARAWR